MIFYDYHHHHKQWRQIWWRSDKNDGGPHVDLCTPTCVSSHCIMTPAISLKRVKPGTSNLVPGLTTASSNQPMRNYPPRRVVRVMWPIFKFWEPYIFWRSKLGTSNLTHTLCPEKVAPYNFLNIVTTSNIYIIYVLLDSVEFSIYFLLCQSWCLINVFSLLSLCCLLVRMFIIFEYVCVCLVFLYFLTC